MKKLVLLVLTCLVGTSIFAQQNNQDFTTERNCASHEVHQKLLREHPEMVAKIAEIEEDTQRKLISGAKAINGSIITIPVVVHVVYNTQQQNISDAQILSQIEVLNEDFRLRNGDRSSAWSDREADIQIEFCLASEDPNGNPTNGITRTSSSRTSFGTNNSIKSTTSGGKSAWDTSEYLNMWVGNIGGGVLGYAQFPGGPASTDGVVMSPQFFGSKAKGNNFFLANNFDLGRTTTHEVGHFLNLRHIWGDGGCTRDDLVSDTPLAGRSNGGCPSTNTNSCNSGSNDERDMYENYMDYTDDRCMNLFTQGQKSRMRAVLLGNGIRSRLANSTKCSGGGGNPTPTPIDNEAPSTPGTLVVSDIQNTSVQLTWGASQDNVGVAGYQIWSGNNNLGTVTVLTEPVTGLVNGTSYVFRIRAIDAAGNTSGFSNSVEVTAGSISTDICAGVAAYNRSLSYSVGDRVTFQGSLYEREATSWANLGPCGSTRSTARKDSSAQAPPLNWSTSLTIYPNPSPNGIIKLAVDGAYSRAFYAVNNLLGQVVKEGSFTTSAQKVDLTALKAGAYIVKVTLDSQVISKTIIIE